jgi:hypothetical protein
MSIDYSGFAIPKGTPRVVDRIQRKADLAAQERACRLAVHKRDKRRCVVPGCRDVARHLHHIQARSLGGKWRTENICSLCVRHHQLLHGGCIRIEGNADVHLTITGEKQYLKFVL